jgi:hypothetical protein
MEKKNEGKSGKKGLWAIIKESMNKASSGCGPGCGCHVDEKGKANQQKDSPGTSGNDKGQA